MSKRTTQTQARVLTVLARMSKAVENDPDEAEMYEEALEPMLSALQAADTFGTEGQTDPRGDFRNGTWSMTRVEGCDSR